MLAVVPYGVCELADVPAERTDGVIEVELVEVLVFPLPPAALVAGPEKLLNDHDDVAVFGQPVGTFSAEEDRVGDTVLDGVDGLGPERYVCAEPVPKVGRVVASWLTFQAVAHSSAHIASDQPSSDSQRAFISPFLGAGSMSAASISNGANFS